MKGRLREPEARHLFQQLIAAIGYCHWHMVTHRDLKPENLLLDDSGAIKVTDFGLSNIMREGRFMNTFCGTPNYAAPEIAAHKSYAGQEVDVWSCGVILYAMVCGFLPFDPGNTNNLTLVMQRTLSGHYQIPAHVSSQLQDLIRKILVVDPLKRMTIEEIAQHPWFADRLPRYLTVLQAGVAGNNWVGVDEDLVLEVRHALATRLNHSFKPL